MTSLCQCLRYIHSYLMVSSSESEREPFPWQTEMIINFYSTQNNLLQDHCQGCQDCIFSFSFDSSEKACLVSSLLTKEFRVKMEISRYNSGNCVGTFLSNSKSSPETLYTERVSYILYSQGGVIETLESICFGALKTD